MVGATGLEPATMIKSLTLVYFLQNKKRRNKYIYQLFSFGKIRLLFAKDK